MANRAAGESREATRKAQAEAWLKNAQAAYDQECQRIAQTVNNNLGLAVLNRTMVRRFHRLWYMWQKAGKPYSLPPTTAELMYPQLKQLPYFNFWGDIDSFRVWVGARFGCSSDDLDRTWMAMVLLNTDWYLVKESSGNYVLVD